MVTDGKPKPGAAARASAIMEQLASAAEEYISARVEVEKAKTNFEVAREKFAVTKRIAIDVLDRSDWFRWQSEHESVKYAGAAIGDAIRDALWDTAYASAEKVA